MVLGVGNEMVTAKIDGESARMVADQCEQHIARCEKMFDSVDVECTGGEEQDDDDECLA